MASGPRSSSSFGVKSQQCSLYRIWFRYQSLRAVRIIQLEPKSLFWGNFISTRSCPRVNFDTPPVIKIWTKWHFRFQWHEWKFHKWRSTYNTGQRIVLKFLASKLFVLERKSKLKGSCMWHWSLSMLSENIVKVFYKWSRWQQAEDSYNPATSKICKKYALCVSTFAADANRTSLKRISVTPSLDTKSYVIWQTTTITLAQLV